jgi:hypothetical protein
MLNSVCVCVCVCVLLGIDPRALHMLVKCSATEHLLYPWVFETESCYVVQTGLGLLSVGIIGMYYHTRLFFFSFLFLFFFFFSLMEQIS